MAAETAELFSICETLDGKSDFNDVDRTSVRCVYMWAVGHQEDNLAELLRRKFKLTEKVYVLSFFLDKCIIRIRYHKKCPLRNELIFYQLVSFIR